MSATHDIRAAEAPPRAPAAEVAPSQPTSVAGVHSEIAAGLPVADARPAAGMCGASDNSAGGGLPLPAAFSMPRWGYRYTPEERAKIRRLATEGKSDREIAGALGRPVSTVGRIRATIARKRAAWHRAASVWNKYQRDRLAAMLQAGRHPLDLGPEFNTTGSAVQMAVSRHGLRHLVKRRRRA